MNKDESHKRRAARIKQVIEQFDSLPDDTRIHEPVVSALLGTSAATTWRHARAGLIPSPSKTGPRATTWRVGDLRDYLAKFRAAA